MIAPLPAHASPLSERLSGNAQAERQFLPLFLARLFHNGQPSGQAAERELMNHMKIVHNQRGQGLTEYIVLLMLVSVISISAVSLLGRTVKGKIEEANKAIARSPMVATAAVEELALGQVLLARLRKSAARSEAWSIS
jgi:Flp pilus assembly pilin Flp